MAKLLNAFLSSKLNSGRFEHLKVAGNNNIVSFVCSACRIGRDENIEKKFNQQKSSSSTKHMAYRAPHDWKKCI